MKNKFIKYLCVLFGTFAVICSALSFTAYVVDPQNVYRWNENGLRYFSPMYSTASAIKNYDYDLAVIGSSMVQNFDAQAIADGLSCKPLKLTIGAMTPNEIMWVYRCANEQDKADTYIINIDLHRFTIDDIAISPGRFTEYTYYANGVSQFKYLLGYETWFRFIPLDLVMNVSDKIGIPLPESLNTLIETSTDINKMCEFDNTNPPGAYKLFQQFIKNEKSFNEGNDYFKNLRKGCKNLEFFLEELDSHLSKDEKLILLLPPYATLYWAKMTHEQQQTLFDMREQLAVFAQERTNVILMDFQSEEYTTDLDKYIDSNHFSVEIENIVVRDIINFSKNSTLSEVSENSERIHSYAENAKAKAALIK